MTEELAGPRGLQEGGVSQVGVADLTCVHPWGERSPKAWSNSMIQLGATVQKLSEALSVIWGFCF